MKKKLGLGLGVTSAMLLVGCGTDSDAELYEIGTMEAAVVQGQAEQSQEEVANAEDLQVGDGNQTLLPAEDSEEGQYQGDDQPGDMDGECDGLGPAGDGSGDGGQGTMGDGSGDGGQGTMGGGSGDGGQGTMGGGSGDGVRSQHRYHWKLTDACNGLLVAAHDQNGDGALDEGERQWIRTRLQQCLEDPDVDCGDELMAQSEDRLQERILARQNLHLQLVSGECAASSEPAAVNES